jgi:serine/threonine protein kinase/dipeptidyl aminopeptidase/acylaminoacyl peptidase
MSIAPGVRLGPYEILAAIGAGGMGEVYRARDTSLSRDVALKILPEVFAHDPDRIARLRREAQLLASLNHPNVGAIYGLDESRGIPVLVLELVEGPTLADRLTRGPIPCDEGLPIARQIADALEAAHERGVVHRDLKPANIKLRSDGTVKVLDFGLAKARDAAAAASDVSLSPTLTSPAMTQMGIVLGTAPYMSPEQACGKTVDKSSDIWAFGCVLFEMLTGKRAFDGGAVTEIIAAVVRAEPEWSCLPTETPDSIRRLLRRCLEKDRKRRLADIRDARLEIDDSQQGPRASSSGVRGKYVWRERLIWSAALLLLGGVATTTLSRRNTATPLAEMRVEITTPPTTDLVSMAISPDGEKIVFVASSDSRPKLWLRSMATGSARPLIGTDGASFPFWSPDSRSIGFFMNGTVTRIDVDGGSLRVLARAPVGAGGSWNHDGVILYTRVPDSPITRVSAMGGTPVLLPGSEPRQLGHRFPQFLPDGLHFLYYVADPAARGEYIGTLDEPDRKRLFDADAAAVFVPPAQVLFLRAGTLFAQRFDTTRLALDGNAVQVAEGVAVDALGAAAVSGSAVDSLIYRIGSVNRQRQLTWFDRFGKPIGEPRTPDASNPLNPEISPDGRLLALNRTVAGNTDVWVLDLGRDTFMRFTSNPGPEIFPLWSPDGSRIVFARSDGQGFKLYQKPTAGAGKETLLLDAAQSLVPSDWSRDGRFLLYRRIDLEKGTELWVLPMDGSGKPFPVVQSNFENLVGQFSPDGRWVAFESNESGRFEIYLQPLPTPTTRAVVSTGGGLQPRFRADGKEIFYIAPDGRLMAVPLRYSSDNQTVEPGTPVPLFLTRVSSTAIGGSGEEYTVSADGQRFLMNAFTERADVPITLVLNRTIMK